MKLTIILLIAVIGALSSALLDQHSQLTKAELENSKVWSVYNVCTENEALRSGK